MRPPLPGIVSKVLAALSLIHSAAAPADEYTQTVPADLLELLTGAEYYRELPPGFPVIDMPAGLSVIGAEDAPGQQQVLLRSGPEGPQAQRAVVAELLGRGWVDITRRPEEGRGFIIPSEGSNTPETFCHDDHGTMQVRGETGVENRVYLDFFLRRDAGWQGCAPLLEARAGMRPPRPAPPAYLQYLPRLEAPPVPSAPLYMPAIMADVISGPRDDYENDQTVPAPGFDAAGVERHYGEQLRAQGWRRDVRWEGDLTAGSTWTRATEEGSRLRFTLLVARAAEELYTVKIRMGELE